MKITLLTPALVAILGLALAGAPVTAQAQTPSTTSDTAASSTTAPAPATTPATAKPKKPSKPRISGNITAIDASSVTIASTKQTLTLTITPTTKFKKDRDVATVADFAVGDKVSCSYTKDATGETADSISKKTASTPAKAPAAAPATTTAPATQ